MRQKKWYKHSNKFVGEKFAGYLRNIQTKVHFAKIWSFFINHNQRKGKRENLDGRDNLWSIETALAQVDQGVEHPEEEIIVIMQS